MDSLRCRGSALFAFGIISSWPAEGGKPLRRGGYPVGGVTAHGARSPAQRRRGRFVELLVVAGGEASGGTPPAGGDPGRGTVVRRGSAVATSARTWCIRTGRGWLIGVVRRRRREPCCGEGELSPAASAMSSAVRASWAWFSIRSVARLDRLGRWGRLVQRRDVDVGLGEQQLFDLAHGQGILGGGGRPRRLRCRFGCAPVRNGRAGVRSAPCHLMCPGNYLHSDGVAQWDLFDSW